MYTKYLYVSPKNIKDDKYLIGARIVTESKVINVQEIFLGVSYSLEEFLNIAGNIGIKSSKKFIVDNYNKNKAVGIIYFPNIKQYSYLNEGDLVVSNKEELNNMITKFYEKENILKRKK